LSVTGSITCESATDPHAGFGRELAVAVRLEREAGQIIETFYQVPTTVKWKDSMDPVTEADRAANAYLIKQLALAFPDDGTLAEESRDDLARLDKRRVWVVDPLDGTVEFIARNGQFCIMVGLVSDGLPVVGVVYQPVDDILYAAALGAGAYVEEFGERQALHVSAESEPARLRPVVSRSHRPPILDDLLRGLGVQKERIVGSLGLKIGLLARGQVDLYLHPSVGTKEWDTCAPDIILSEAGGIMSDCWNRPLRYNQREVKRQFGVMASNGVAHAWLAKCLADLLDEAGLDPGFGF
jgi:3'(2'), 5'-bisphosphate nucleotidase